ncbi:DUF6169 family protein [Spirosoma foliorum]|uniref:Uncharacterized protein n=1 Tax=Spirosoma foliorum TaxID=2710596 RepID=A0A7G5GNT6_9BACT|nr:DUF6169 family protein [Spirosoma foliorum]QMW00528.1 hypothetical protein H3H32_21275 [Spirosoma foliorum]
MPNDELQPNYEFIYAGGEQNAYFFSTDNDIAYQVKFVPSNYLFAARAELQIQAFEMSISVAQHNTGGRLPADQLISPTIAAIFFDFFRTRDQVVVYVCDTSDKRQSARARKFDAWFYSYGHSHLAKLNKIIPDRDRFTFISMILHDQHPYRSQVAEAFFELGEEYK